MRFVFEELERTAVTRGERRKARAEEPPCKKEERWCRIHGGPQHGARCFACGDELVTVPDARCDYDCPKCGVEWAG